MNVNNETAQLCERVKQLEQELEESRRQAQKVHELEQELAETYRSVVELTNEVEDQIDRFSRLEKGLGNDYCFLTIDLDGEIMTASASFPNVYGYSSVDAFNKADPLTRHQINEDREARWEQLSAGHNLPPSEWELIDEEGEIRRVEAKVFPVKDSRGRVCRFEGLARDITQRKKREHIFLAAQERAQRGIKAKNQFVAHMSHELRTPLNGVLGYVQLLQQEEALPTDARYFINSIERCGTHLLTLINRILDFSKFESEGIHLKPERTHLPSQFFDLHEIVRYRANDKGLDLHWEIDNTIPELVEIDATKLKQVLLNLLDNAFKFTSSGHVTLRVQPDDARWRFEVSDTGPGIKPEDQELIFSPFRQSSAGEIDGGTGLGLAISQRIVDAMGGHLQVESQLGQGSSFRFSLELKPLKHYPRTPTLGGLRLPTTHPTTNELIQALVVDDDPINRDILTRMLQRSGIIVHEASDIEGALAMWKHHQHHLVLMDVLVQGKDGLTIARKIRESDTAQPLLLAVSGHVSPQQEKLAKKSGCQAFLPKPVQFTELISILRTFLPVEETARPTSQPQAVPPPQTHPQERLSPPERSHLQGLLHTLRSSLELGDFFELSQLLQNAQLLRQRWPEFHKQFLEAAESFHEPKAQDSLATFERWLHTEEQIQ